jgi:hypothetical protein
MNYRDAQEKLKEIVDLMGVSYYRVSYSEVYTKNGLHVVECCLYIEGVSKIITGKTWEHAFELLDAHIHPEIVVLTTEGAPE